MSQRSNLHNQAPPTSLADAAFSNPRERAMAHLVSRGVLIVDDKPSQLEALHEVCASLWEIPEKLIRVVCVDRSGSVAEIATTLEQTIREHVRLTGEPFANIITDYNFTPVIHSIDVWKVVEAKFTADERPKCWTPTGRVLVTGSERDAIITLAEQEGLIDGCLHKPLKLDFLTSAVCNSVLKRIG